MFLESQAEELTRLLNTRVSIRPGSKNRGKVEIEYYSLEELEGLIERLGGSSNV